MVSGKYWRWKIKWEVTLTNLVYSLLILKNIARFFYNYFCEISPLSTSTLYHLFGRVYFTQEPHYEYRVEYNFWRKNPRRDEKIPQRSYEAFPYDICDFNFGKFKKKRKNSSNIILHVWRLILVETRNCPFFCPHLFLCSFSGNAYTKRTTEATEWIFKRSRSTHACIIQGKAFPCLENFIPSSPSRLLLVLYFARSRAILSRHRHGSRARKISFRKRRRESALSRLTCAK